MSRARCQAQVPKGAYTPTHRCEKDRRVRVVATPSGPLALCPHHRAVLSRDASRLVAA